jgi:hypothetical protein
MPGNLKKGPLALPQPLTKGREGQPEKRDMVINHVPFWLIPSPRYLPKSEL